MEEGTIELLWFHLPPWWTSAAPEAVVSFVGAGKGICALREEGHGSGKVIDSHRLADDTTSEKLGRAHIRPPTSKNQRSDLKTLVTSGAPSRCVIHGFPAVISLKPLSL